MKFQQTIGSLGLLFAGISSVIGSGWLFGPLYAAQIAGPGAVLSWVIGGVLMIIIALTFAELGTTFPVAGGMIQYAQNSHGPLISFMIGWMVWISSVAVAPVETMGLIQYAANYIPALINNVSNQHMLSNYGILAAAIIMLFMCILNYYGARFFSRSNSIITTIKLIVPISTFVLLIAIAFNHTHFTQGPGGFLPYGWHGIFAALPLGGVIYSFIGSNTVLQLAAETRNPQKSIPLALIGSMIFCTILYAGLQIAFIGAVNTSSFANGWHSLNFIGDSGPFSGIMLGLGLGWFVMIIYADALISPFGTGYVFTASTARVSYGLSDVGFLPQGLKKLTAKGTPLRCIILNYFIGLLLFLPFPMWQKLVSFIISCFIISYIIGPLSLLALRKSHPDIHRPFKLPFAHVISLFAFYICNLLIFWTGWQTVYRMMIALCVGLLFFAWYCFKQNKSLWFSQWKSSWWILPYFILLTTISYLGTFGNGLGILSFGYDFVAIAFLTLLTLYFESLANNQQFKAEISIN